MKDIWVEKYRPKTVDEYVFKDEAQKHQVKSWITDGGIPHLLFSGSAGTGKTTLAKPFAKLIGGVHINADEVREKYSDWDFTPEGRTRQAQRMRHLADGVVMAGKIAIADFVCPTDQTRIEFDANFTVWMDTVQTSQINVQSGTLLYAVLHHALTN